MRLVPVLAAVAALGLASASPLAVTPAEASCFLTAGQGFNANVRCNQAGIDAINNLINGGNVLPENGWSSDDLSGDIAGTFAKTVSKDFMDINVLNNSIGGVADINASTFGASVVSIGIGDTPEDLSNFAASVSFASLGTDLEIKGATGGAWKSMGKVTNETWGVGGSFSGTFSGGSLSGGFPNGSN